MYPTRGDLHVAPFCDEAVYLEQTGKAGFWAQDSFHGVDLSALRPQAVAEYFKQPIVVRPHLSPAYSARTLMDPQDTFHVGILTARSVPWSLDFLSTAEADLVNIDIPLSFTVTNTAYIHGLAFW